MRRALARLFLVLCPVVAAFAQAGQDSRCPEITVYGPAGVTAPGEPIRFTASIKPYDTEKMNLFWKVESLHPTEQPIIKGQGTTSIEIQSSKRSPFNIEVTLEVKGVSEGCVSTARETVGVVCKCVVEAIQEYGKVSWKEEKQKLSQAIYKNKEQPESLLYILKYFDRPAKTNGEKIRRVEDYLSKEKQILMDRFKVILIESIGPERTRIFLVPPGADYPTVN